MQRPKLRATLLYRFARSGAIAGALGCVLTGAFTARAADANYQSFLVGGRAVALGGAYVSLSDDPSGAYYNPAGIADVEETSYSVSTSLYGFERGGYGDALVLPVAGLESLRVEFADLVIVPASAGLVSTFGAPGPDGKPVQAYALTVVVPSFRTFTATDPFGEPEPGGDFLRQDSTLYRRSVTDRSLWAGLAYGRKIGSMLRLGVSAFYILRSNSDVESVTTRATLDDGDGDASNDSHVFRSGTNEIDFLNGSLVVILGAKLLITPELTVGLSVQTPSIPIHSESTLRFSLAESIPACQQLGLPPERLSACQREPLLAEPRSNFTNVTLNGTSETAQPANIRMGLNYSKSYRFTVAADLVLHMPTEYRLLQAPGLTPDLASRLPFNPNVRREAVLNFNVGAEYLLVREVSVAAGFFSDFSSAPHISRLPTADAQPDVDIFGLTLSLGYFGEHSLSRIGVLYSFGQGTDVIPNSDVERLLRAEQRFQRVEYFQSFFYVFVSSTFRY